MGVSALLEKLINEHGSATILKERVSLLKDQIIDLENENESLKAENAVFDYKIKELESKVQNIEKEKKSCQKRLNEIHSITISERHISVLIAVATYSGQHPGFFAKVLKISEQETLAKLNYLSSLSLLHYRDGVLTDQNDPKSRPTATKMWFVSQPGHVYIKANNLNDKIA